MFVDLLRPADEADGGHAVAPAREGFLGGGGDFGVVGEAEVVVGAEDKDFGAVAEAAAWSWASRSFMSQFL